MQDQRPTRRNCGAQIEHRRLLNEDPAYVAARSEIETLARAYESGARSAERPGITRIPVVVHVVWNTPQQNISDAQIQSQIEVLNQDFRRTNPDSGEVPGVWQSVTADARIEFFLATTDPNGNPTNGITRTQTQTVSFPRQGNPVKSAATGGADPWPSGEYLNMWVCQLAGSLLGYAQFPGGPADTDGVVILHSGFGTNGTAAAPFDRGRTATHEIGHWLNCFHIWGDDGTGCNGTDEVDDTPNQADENTGCPNFPSVSCNNGPNGDMFMNYMDYTDDECMFMFTLGQVARMQAALDGPRASIGSTAPGVFAPNENWTGGPYYGTRGTYFADVTGDGRADAIVVNDDRVTVRPSTGSDFGPNEDWTTNPYYGGNGFSILEGLYVLLLRGAFFADVTGDGKADAIVVNKDTVTVRRSNGSSFEPNEDWTFGPYYGTRGTFFADVTGDGKADAIVVNDDTATVRRST